MNFTWFASSFDTDDVLYRLLTMVQMGGVLVLAAGVPAALDDGDYRAVTIGYLIMRIGLVAQWLRAAIEDPPSRVTALALRDRRSRSPRSPGCSASCSTRPGVCRTRRCAVFLGLVAFELAVPLWAERGARRTWHPHHIAERYGLFTIILLGESVLAASTGVERGARSGRRERSLVAIAAPGWCSSSRCGGSTSSSRRRRARRAPRPFVPVGLRPLRHLRRARGLGAGLEVAVEQTGHDVAASPVAIGYAVAIPVAVVLTLLWALHAPICRAAGLQTGGDPRGGRRDPRPAARSGVHTAGCRVVDRGRVRPSVPRSSSPSHRKASNGVHDRPRPRRVRRVRELERRHRPAARPRPPVIAAANPLRSLAGDAASVSDLVAHVEGPSCSSATPTAARSSPTSPPDAGDIVGLVYVAAFAPEPGESAFTLVGKFPGSTLGDALGRAAHRTARPTSTSRRTSSTRSSPPTSRRGRRADGGDAAPGHRGGAARAARASARVEGQSRPGSCSASATATSRAPRSTHGRARAGPPHPRDPRRLARVRVAHPARRHE